MILLKIILLIGVCAVIWHIGSQPYNPPSEPYSPSKSEIKRQVRREVRKDIRRRERWDRLKN